MEWGVAHRSAYWLVPAVLASASVLASCALERAGVSVAAARDGGSAVDAPAIDGAGLEMDAAGGDAGDAQADGIDAQIARVDAFVPADAFDAGPCGARPVIATSVSAEGITIRNVAIEG